MRLKSLLIALSCALLFLDASLFAEKCNLVTFAPSPFLRLGYTGGKSIGVKVGYGTVGLHNPIFCPASNFQIITDVRAHYLQSHFWAANAGVGVRRTFCDGSQLLGANVFYDFRDAHAGAFHQVGAGFEWLTRTWNFRLNGYFPLVSQKIAKPKLFSFDGEPFATCTLHEWSKTYFDAEIGRLFGECNMPLFYVGAGAYYVHDKKISEFGGKLHGAVKVNRFLYLEALAYADKDMGTRAQVRATFFFGLKPCDPCDPCPDQTRFISQPIQRNDLIAIEHECCWGNNFVPQ